jgi:hypothetical protein
MDLLETDFSWISNPADPNSNAGNWTLSRPTPKMDSAA